MALHTHGRPKPRKRTPKRAVASKRKAEKLRVRRRRDPK